MINWFFDDYYLGKIILVFVFMLNFVLLNYFLFYFYRKEVGYKVFKGDNFILFISKVEVDLIFEMI